MSTRKKMTDEQINARVSELEGAANEHRRLRDELSAREQTAVVTPLVGRYFKYSNSYGSGKRWWLYAKVTGVTGAGRFAYPKAVSFQDDTEGRLSAEIDRLGITISEGNGWREITAREYKAAAARFAKKITKALSL